MVQDRRPLARSESLTPPETLQGKTVHLAPSTWDRVREQARHRGFDEYLVFLRKLIEHALEDAEVASRMEASVGMPLRTFGGSRGVRRNAQVPRGSR